MAGKLLSKIASRMAEIRKARRDAGFNEVTIWVPKEEVRTFRDLAWQAVEACGRSFPHRAPDGQHSRQRSKK
ncbi:hypothetical protein [Tritonibacter mobilis]|uniref:hypothetical protein n=1 Tax=Tritonibacter mobilis TaxID=379347 RepID=UPI000E0E041C|nr:hypothetical protein [Tritonibacter mobilis]